MNSNEECPAQALLKLLAGKWKPELFRLAADAPLRFNQALRQIPGVNKQGLNVALRELEGHGLFIRTVVQRKPLHIEYSLSEKGKAFVPVFRQLETLL
jgi:DNA-binding HxlR family transcriptional regulator